MEFYKLPEETYKPLSTNELITSSIMLIQHHGKLTTGGGGGGHKLTRGGGGHKLTTGGSQTYHEV